MLKKVLNIAFFLIEIIPSKIFSNIVRYVPKLCTKEQSFSFPQPTPDILNCIDPRTFHISWTQNYLTLRRDDFVGKELLRWYSPKPIDINYITLTSPGDETLWDFSGLQGKCHSF